MTHQASPLFDRITIIGLGLIGSSLLHGAKTKKLATQTIGYDVSPDIRARAKAINLGDKICDELKEAIQDADLIILAIPVGAMGSAAALLSPHLKKGALLSDVGSVKRGVIDAVTPHVPDHVHFIPAHPVAGTEYSGPEAGFAALFEDRWSILTPHPDTNAKALERLTSFWQGLGAKVELMDPDHHDLVLAITSHVPHLIAYNIVGTAADLEAVTQKEVIKYSAGGFRDFTRIASSDPIMWRDIFLANKDGVLEMLGKFQNDLTTLQTYIQQGDGQALEDLFTRTRDIRRSIIDAGQETADPDFGRRS